MLFKTDIITVKSNYPLFSGSKKPQVTRSPTSPIPKLPKEKEFVKKNINRPRGFIKKVSIATMLAHSKVGNKENFLFYWKFSRKIRL